MSSLITVRIDVTHPDRSVRLIDTLIIDPNTIKSAPLGTASLGNASSSNDEDKATIHSSRQRSVTKSMHTAVETFSIELAGQIVADYEVNGTQRVTKHFNGRLSFMEKEDFVRRVAIQIRDGIVAQLYPEENLAELVEESLSSNKRKQESADGTDNPSIYENDDNLNRPTKKRLRKIKFYLRLQSTVLAGEIDIDTELLNSTPGADIMSIANSIVRDLNLSDEMSVFIAGDIIAQLNRPDVYAEDVKLTAFSEDELKVGKKVDAKEVFAAEYKVLTECHP